MKRTGQANRGGVVLVSILAVPLSSGQDITTGPDTKPKADVIFVDGNVYTGVPPNPRLASI